MKSKLIASIISLSLISSLAFADNAADDLACTTQTPALIKEIRNSHLQAIKATTVSTLKEAYAMLNVSIEENAVHFILIDQSFNLDRSSLKLEASVDAGANSAQFIVSSDVNVNGVINNQGQLVASRERINEYDSIGRLKTTRLECLLYIRLGLSWNDYEFQLKNKATDYFISNSYPGDTVLQAKKTLP